MPDFPLIGRALEWGINVKAVPGNYKYFGYYSPGQTEIALATSSECVSFHELSHCAHHIIKGGLLTGQDPLQEMVAELSAQALALMVGKSAKDTTGNGYRCIEKYTQKTDMQVHTACLKVLAETEKVLNLILTGQIGSKGKLMKAA